MPTVLVVDDNPMDLRLAGACVEQCGLATRFASNGSEALQLLDGADFVLTDLDMPELNGLELVRRLQSRVPKIPVILMTAYGSEEIAAEALRAGASSYVPKRHLQRELQGAIRIVQQAALARDRRQNVYQYLESSQSQFVIGNDDQAAASLVNHLQDALILMKLCTESELLAIGTALLEALQHAIDRGNLELDSELRRQNHGNNYAALRRQRLSQTPYKDRKVHVLSRLDRASAVFTIRDEGPGFDLATIPDADNADNLMQEDSRGLVLIQMFMDEVSFNDAGNEITLSLFADPAP
jgi:CheY-like chemotaxis protein